MFLKKYSSICLMAKLVLLRISRIIPVIKQGKKRILFYV